MYWPERGCGYDWPMKILAAALLVIAFHSSSEADDEVWAFCVRSTHVAADFATTVVTKGETRQTRQPILRTKALPPPNTNYILVEVKLDNPVDRTYFESLEAVGAAFRIYYARLFHKDHKEQVERKSVETHPQEGFKDKPRDFYKVWVSCP